MSNAQEKILAETRALYQRYQELKQAVAAVNVTTHQFITDLDMFILATGIVEEVGISQRSWAKWNKEWDARLRKAEVFVEGKQIEYGVSPESTETATEESTDDES